MSSRCDSARSPDGIHQLLQARMARQPVLQHSKTRASSVEVPQSQLDTDGYGDRQWHADKAHTAARARLLPLTLGLLKGFLVPRRTPSEHSRKILSVTFTPDTLSGFRCSNHAACKARYMHAMLWVTSLPASSVVQQGTVRWVSTSTCGRTDLQSLERDSSSALRRSRADSSKRDDCHSYQLAEIETCQ